MSARACPTCQNASPAQQARNASLAALRNDAESARDAVAPRSVHDTLARSGAPLDPRVRGQFEQSLGYDLSGVRVHTDTDAARSARDVGALAYTVGNHVVFGGGRFAPGNQAGDKLLAHELTHVEQQRGAAGAGSGLRISDSGEHEARHAETGGVRHGAAFATQSAQSIQRAPDPEDVKSFKKEIAEIRELKLFKARLNAATLAGLGAHKKFDEIVEIAGRRDNPLYYSGKLRLLFSTDESDPKDQSARNAERIKQGVNREADRLAMADSPSTSREEHVSTQRADAGRFEMMPGLDTPVTFEIDKRDRSDIAVRIKVFLHPEGHGTQEDVDRIKAMEDAIEKRASTVGYSFDVEFVPSMQAAKGDVFSIPVDTSKWTTSGNFAGDDVSIAHELHHIVGLSEDRYNYIESHAGNKDMLIVDRLTWFHEELIKKATNDRDSIMNRADRSQLDEDVCRVAGGKGVTDLEMEICSRIRKSERERSLQPAVDLAQLWLKQALAKPHAVGDAVAKSIFTTPPPASVRAQILGLASEPIKASNLLAHSELDPRCVAGRLAFEWPGPTRQIRFCPLFMQVPVGFQANALLVESLHLARVGSSDEKDCPANAGCARSCGGTDNARAWARFIQCSASA